MTDRAALDFEDTASFTWTVTDDSAGNRVKVQAAFSGLANPMTTPADIIVGGTAGAPTRLAKGTDGQVLTVDPSTHLLKWADPSGGMANPMTTQDDIIVGGSSGTPGRLAKGTDGQVLTVDPSTHHLVWATPSSVPAFATPAIVLGTAAAAGAAGRAHAGIAITNSSLFHPKREAGRRPAFCL